MYAAGTAVTTFNDIVIVMYFPFSTMYEIKTNMCAGLSQSYIMFSMCKNLRRPLCIDCNRFRLSRRLVLWRRIFLVGRTTPVLVFWLLQIHTKLFYHVLYSYYGFCNLNVSTITAISKFVSLVESFSCLDNNR